MAEKKDEGPLYKTCPFSMAAEKVKKCRDKGECYLWDDHNQCCKIKSLLDKLSFTLWVLEGAYHTKGWKKKKPNGNKDGKR